MRLYSAIEYRQRSIGSNAKCNRGGSLVNK